MEKREKAMQYLLDHIEDFGEAKYTRTKETQCIGKLTYNCVSLAVAMEIIKIMEE